MPDSNGVKEGENFMHKVGIRLGKRPMMEEQINVEEKPADEQPNNDVVVPEVVVVTPKVDFRIQFTADRKFEQRADMLQWVRDLSEKLCFVVVTTKSHNLVRMVGKATLLLDVKEAVNIGSTPRRKVRRR
jgi:hypothetical protein